MDDDLRRKGEEASRFVAGLRAARKNAPVVRPAFRAKGERLPDDWLHDPRNLAVGGWWRYSRDREARIIDEARQRIADERQSWRERYLSMLEFHLAHATDPATIAGLKDELRNARRALGLNKPTAETVKAQTRERVRRHRARHRSDRPA